MPLDFKFNSASGLGLRSTLNQDSTDRYWVNGSGWVSPGLTFLSRSMSLMVGTDEKNGSYSGVYTGMGTESGVTLFIHETGNSNLVIGQQTFYIISGSPAWNYDLVGKVLGGGTTDFYGTGVVSQNQEVAVTGAVTATVTGVVNANVVSFSGNSNTVQWLNNMISNGLISASISGDLYGKILGSGSSSLQSTGVAVNIPDCYFADIEYNIDDSGSPPADEYTVFWYKNSAPLTTGVTAPQLTVVKRSDGLDLIPTTGMTGIGSLMAFKYTATGEFRQADGEAIIVNPTATIDGVNRSWIRLFSRDINPS